MCSDGCVHAPQSSDTAPGHVGTDPRRLLEVAVTVAEEAAAHVRARRPEVFGIVGTRAESGDSVASKSTPTDPVTVVDTESEQVIRDRLAELRPEDAILGEEGGGEGDSVAGVRWIVDPIDGTVNFLYGVPAYAVSVAAQIDGVSVAGVVVDVAARSTYAAARGGGATLTDADGRVSALRCNPVTDVSMALLATGFGYGAARRKVQGALIADILPRVRDIRRIGSAALDLCMVAAGRVDAHFEHGLSPWDWAAGSLIATEAGARVQIPSPHTSSVDGEVVVAAAPGIADALDALFAEIGADRAIPEE
ncbi:myo-inositol-1(or 4)-monophosphatase [Rhodococcus koreensis]|uniref:Inositol-1-monophosphatase n=1 Tax=Rhodococcus koreensis TaxID=99653 RepID=A0A1H4N0R9_9NOCA|nr:myo-inositol-1(or 4)-monophosphatase [Rhodococcus koreensis]